MSRAFIVGRFWVTPEAHFSMYSQSAPRIASSHVRTVIGYSPKSCSCHRTSSGISRGGSPQTLFRCLIESWHSASIHSRSAPGVPASPMISTGIFLPPRDSPWIARLDASCAVLLFLPAPSVTFAMTTDAKRNQVVHHIVTKLTPGFHVMDLQAFHGTALLTPPAISLQDPDSEFRVLFRAQFMPGLFLT